MGGLSGGEDSGTAGDMCIRNKPLSYLLQHHGMNYICVFMGIGRRGGLLNCYGHRLNLMLQDQPHTQAQGENVLPRALSLGTIHRL